jgi:hypothetical protein
LVIGVEVPFAGAAVGHGVDGPFPRPSSEPACVLVEVVGLGGAGGQRFAAVIGAGCIGRGRVNQLELISEDHGRQDAQCHKQNSYLHFIYYKLGTVPKDLYPFFGIIAVGWVGEILGCSSSEFERLVSDFDNGLLGKH